MKINTTVSNPSKDFNLFHSIFLNWKLILITSFIFGFLGVGYVFLVPKTFISSAEFSISLNNSIETTFGSYNLKTQNPSHYLSTFQSEVFKENVSSKIDEIETSDFNFKVIEERIHKPTDGGHLIFPSKFELRVFGTKKSSLTEITKKSIELFLSTSNLKLQRDMFSFFKSTLIKEIEDIKMKIEVKKNLLEGLAVIKNETVDLKPMNKGSIDSITTKLTSNAQIDNSFLITTMLLNQERGTQNYLNSVITVETVGLSELDSELYFKSLQLNRILENKESLTTVFGEPFTNSFLLLSSPEVVKNNLFIKGLKQILVFIILGFILGTLVVSFKSYFDKLTNR